MILNFDAQAVLAAINLVYCPINPSLQYCPGGGGGVLYSIYKTYRYVPPQRVGFWRRFVLKTDIDFVHFGLESGNKFLREVRECIMGVFAISVSNELERMINGNSKMDFKKSFCWRLI